MKKKITYKVLKIIDRFEWDCCFIILYFLYGFITNLFISFKISIPPYFFSHLSYFIKVNPYTLNYFIFSIVGVMIALHLI